MDLGSVHLLGGDAKGLLVDILLLDLILGSVFLERLRHGLLAGLLGTPDAFAKFHKLGLWLVFLYHSINLHNRPNFSAVAKV